jgi:hypothetical protein
MNPIKTLGELRKDEQLCRLFDYLLTIPVNCNALKTLHVWENVRNATLVWSKYNIHSQNTKAICTCATNDRVLWVKILRITTIK